MTNTVPKINFSTIEFLTAEKVRIDSIKNFVTEWNNESDHILVKTSGSTGKPKEIFLKKFHFIESAKITGNFFDFKKNQKIVLSLSIDTIGGKMQVIRALIFEMKLLITENSRNPIQNFNQNAYFISLSPIQLEEIIKQNPEKIELFTHVLIGGAKLSSHLENKLKDLKASFHESYGMTETLSHVALREISKSNYFIKLKNIELSENEGCLQINAPSIGVQNLLTNDYVEFMDENSFIIKGRKDFVINSGGYKFHPEILEEKLYSFIPFPYFIIGEKNDEYGEIISLYLECEYDEKKLNNLKNIFLNQLIKYEIPKKIYFVEEFERTESNKINRIETQKLILKAKY